MDRRNFLKTTAAATAATAAAGAAADGSDAARFAPETDLAAPALATAPVRELRLVTPWPLELPSVGESARRLARRIETASAGRYRIAIEEGPEGSVEAIMTGAADLTFASDHTNLTFDPAFAYFAGLPLGCALAPEDHVAWLAAAGGQLLWDDLGARHGLKPLLAGHTGGQLGLWARNRIESVSDLAGSRIFVRGLGRATVAALGARPLLLPAAELGPALADGRIDAAEWAGPFASLALGLQNGARLLYEQGVNAGGTAFTLAVRLGLWERLPPADRALLEGAAAEELQLSLAEARARDPRARTILAGKRAVEMLSLPADVAGALASSAGDVVAAVAASSAAARRIDDSHRAFRTGIEGSQPFSRFDAARARRDHNLA